MNNKINELKWRAIQAIESERAHLCTLGDRLFHTPETGFREHRTAAIIKEELEALGLAVESEIAITGLKARAEGTSHERCVGVMGELDALLIPSHIHADPKTGYGHACGHHAQLTMLVGCAIGLIKSGVISELCGDVTFLAVPAEEVVELDFRKELIRDGKIQFVGGKQEFIRLGVFDGIDAVLCSHLSSVSGGGFRFGQSYNGVVHKHVRFIGKAAHAGMAPHLGINALSAAVNAINAINALRETLPASETPRIHYVITKGGNSVNIIPDDVQMEFGVRAATSSYLAELNEAVNRAIEAGAAAAGATAVIDDLGAYQPTYQDKNLTELFAKNAADLVGEERLENATSVHRGSSTDVGDVASLIPTIHTNFDGAKGSPHTAAYDVADPDFAYVEVAKVIASTVIDLLYSGGECLDRIKKEYKPTFKSKEEHAEYYRRLLRRAEDKERITQGDQY